ncbi:putative disease resistance protein RGA3 [Prunus yedoensis var. nudiflora]|uniref:Putative disease resistance protein RGA3 n=1 Tax=Prunus yedoensis var. nudiflora TaxID=2094558 RepID=A0A314Y104_PRUYE|nr:putative disease resistance protein RGA3 [Prunus yedoensis var. nudiflora]
MADAVVSPLLKVLSNRLDSLAEALGYDVIFKKMRDALGSLGALASQVEEQPLGQQPVNTSVANGAERSGLQRR